MIFFTGGLGFIGGNTINYFLKKTGQMIVNIDKQTYASNKNFNNIFKKSKKYLHKKTDICSKNILKLFLKYKPDLIINFAAETHVDNSIAHSHNFVNSNILGTYNLLETVRLYLKRCPNKNFKFIHISTDEVYGDLGSQKSKFHEKFSYNPSSPYSATKAASDHLVTAWSRTYRIPFIIINMSNNYGPYQNSEKLIPKIISNCLNKKYIPIYGKGNQIRDWLFVEDAAEAIYKISRSKYINQKFCIGGNNPMKNIDLAKKICINISKKMNDQFDYLELLKFTKDRPGHDIKYEVDISKVKRLIKWSPSTSFDNGINKTINFFIKNNLK